jgi:hypothetical protein
MKVGFSPGRTSLCTLHFDGGSRGVQPPEMQRIDMAFRPGPLPVSQELPERQPCPTPTPPPQSPQFHERKPVTANSIQFVSRNKALLRFAHRSQNKNKRVTTGWTKRHRQQKRRPRAALFVKTNFRTKAYNVDSISKPQASSRASGIYFEFLFLRAHSRSRVDRIY